MPRRRISRASKRRLIIFGTISLIVIVSFCFSLIYNAYTIYDLSMEKKRMEKLYVDLQEDAESLKKEIEKLNDDSYLANYAREHFLYSKDGEYILQIDDIEQIEDDITFEINKTYVIIGLSLLMFFIFVYILSKVARKKIN